MRAFNPNNSSVFRCELNGANRYAAGARIHSNSWGHSANTYDDYPRSIDEYAHTPTSSLAAADFIPLFHALPATTLHHSSLSQLIPHNSYVSTQAPDMLILFSAANQGAYPPTHPLPPPILTNASLTTANYKSSSPVPSPPSSMASHLPPGAYGTASVGSPATCKNCLTVGASEGSVQVRNVAWHVTTRTCVGDQPCPIIITNFSL